MGYNPSDLHGISRVNPLIIGVITHLLSGMSHQVNKNNGIDHSIVVDYSPLFLNYNYWYLSIAMTQEPIEDGGT